MTVASALSCHTATSPEFAQASSVSKTMKSTPKFYEVDSSRTSDFAEQEDHDMKLATLLSHGFEQPDIEVALRKSNNDVTKAYNILSSAFQPIKHFIPASNDDPVNDDHEAGPSSEVFPVFSFKSVRRTINTEECGIFSISLAVMRCVEVSKELLNNNIFDPLCNEFLDVYLPKCITLHVSPPEPLYFTDVNLRLSVNFCKEATPLIAKRLSTLPVPFSLCHAMTELFNSRNKMFSAYRRLSPSEFQNCAFDFGQTYCNNRKTMTGKEHTHRLLQELIDLFISSNGFGNVNELLQNYRDKLSPKDIIALLNALDSFHEFLDSDKMDVVLKEITEESLLIIDEVDEKQVRDSLCRNHVVEATDICMKWIDLLGESAEACNRTRLKFFLRCITCNQLDAKVFAFHELGRLAGKLRSSSNLVYVSAFNSWLKDNNIIKHALQGNMDQPTYLEKIRPILSYMTSEMSASDLAGVWSLRKGRMGVSSDNFSTILVQIGKGFNCEQIGWLEQLFIKCFHANETRMYDRVFLCCRDIAIFSELPQIAEKMLSIMWNLIGLARKKNFMTLNAVKWFVEVISNKRNMVIKDDYIKKSLDALTTHSGEVIVSTLVILRELLELSSNIVSQVKNTRPSSRGFRSRDLWGDLAALETNLDGVKKLVAEADLVKMLYEKLSSCKDFVQKSNHTEGSDNLLAVVLSEGCTYSFVVKNMLAVLKWLILNQVVEFSNETCNNLWSTLSTGSNYSAEIALLFDWLTEFSVSAIKPSTLTALLHNFCSIPANRLTLDGLKCLCHLMDSNDDHGARDEASAGCVEYMWQVLEVSEDEEIVSTVMQKHIEMGSRDNECLQYRMFLSSCYTRLDKLRTEYFRRIGKVACPSPSLNKLVASPEKKGGGEGRNTPTNGGRSSGNEDNPQIKSSQKTAPELMLTNETPPTTPRRSLCDLSPQHILRGIDRILRLIAIFVESEDNLYFMPRHYPPHGVLVPGRPLRVFCRVDDDPSDDNSLIVRTNSHEAIGQFRSRLSNRLHFLRELVFEGGVSHTYRYRAVSAKCQKNTITPTNALVGLLRESLKRKRSIGVYKIYVQRGEKSVEVPCAHEWKTLEQVGMVALRDGICETEDVDISVRCPRLSVSSVKCDSGKCISEKHLPGVIVHETSGVFPMLYELLGIADGEIQKACQRILALIPVDPTVLSALAIKESPSKSVHENLDENAVINKHLTPSDPFRLLYTLEVLSGLLVPTSATKGTVAISNRLSRAILKSDVYNHLLKLLTIPHTIAPIAASERTRIFELLTLIFGVLLHGQSVLSNAITHDGQCLADLQSFKRSERRKDPLYEDLSTLAIDSTSAISSFNCDEFSTLLTMLRDCAWRAAAGWLLHSLRLPVHNSYFGILPRGSEAPSGATSPSEVFLDLPAFNVPDAPSASESIRRSGAEALDDRSEALANDILMLMTRCLIGRLNSSRVDRDEKKGLLKLCTTDVWRDFWKDVLVYTVTDRLRRHARDALVNIARSLSVESDICTLLFMLLETMEAVPFCKNSSVKIDRLAHRQLDNALDLHLCLASILDLGRIHSEDNRGFWRIVERDPVQIAWEIFDFMTSMGLDANYSDIDADFVYSKLCVLKAVLQYSNAEARVQIGDKFMTSVLGCCVFAQVLSSSSSKVWEAKNSLFALEILADLSESVPRNAARLIDWLYNYFGELRELEWEFRPMLESRVLDHVGLQNAGGTCYMNSVLQQLFAIPGLAAHLFSIEMPKGENSENSQLLAAVQSVFARLAMTRCRLYVPREIWDTFRFYGADRLDTRQQHDAVDFFTELIDRVDSALEAQKMPLLFRPRLCGKFTYEYICYGCFHRHIGAEEEFLAVNLELHGPSLEECLEHYVNGELLECDNAYYCCKCEEKRNTLRRGSFCKLPSTLTIQLKRFSYDINGRVDKKNDFCSFPMVLDMAPYCSQARAVCDQELKSLFDDVYSSEQEDGCNSNEEAGANSLEPHPSPSSPSRWGRKRRKTSSLPNMDNSENCQYELVGVVVHSGGARAGHYVSYVKERRPEMRHTSTYEKWVELNDAEVRLFPATPEAMECEWFGGSFTASPSTTFSPRLDLPKERLRSYSAYVLIYEKKDARVNAVSEKPPRLPLQLLNCVDNENVSFLKDRDLFSSSYGYAVSKTVSNFVTYLEGAEDLKNEEHVKMAVAIFDMLFDYCYKALWRLSYEAREGRVFDMSVNGIRGLLRLSSAVRQKFFELLTNYNYKVFYTMMSCPEDVCGAWWRVVGDALTCWFDDHDASRVPQTSVKLPAGIISRMIGQIKMAGQSNECCVNCVLRCLNGFVCNSSSGSFLLVADGALQAVSDLIATDWSATTHVHNHSDTRGARQLTLVLYSMLLKYIRSEPLAKKYFPLQTHSENLTSMSAWLYSEYPGDRKMCDVIEEIFSLTEQIHPIFLIDVVKFLLNEIWTGIYKESWPAIVRFMVGVCRRLEEAGIDSAFGYLAMLWDGWSADDFLNESEVPKGLITQAEELLASCEYEKLKIYVDCFLKWKHEGCQNASIADVFNSAGRADRIAVCSQRLAEERVQSPHQGSSEAVASVRREKWSDFENVYSKVKIPSAVDEVPGRVEYDADIEEDDGIGISPPSLTPTITEFEDSLEPY